MKRFWSKVPVSILDNPAWGTLPDDQWRKRFEALVTREDNIFCDTEFKSVRAEYLSRRNGIKRHVFSKNPHWCKYCGSTSNLEIDHIVPLARGGTNDLNNFQILCRTCNRKKWAKL